MTPTTSPTKNKSRYHIVSGKNWKAMAKIIPGPNNLPREEIWVESEPIKNLRKAGAIFVSDAFLPIMTFNRGLLLLDGGYGSSKTTTAIIKLLLLSIELPYFRCFYGRNKKTEARQLHLNIITEIKRQGWEDQFSFSETPTGTTNIVCKKNGNMFILFGCDDAETLKGWDNPTHVLLDEINQVSFEIFGMIYTRLRTPGVEKLFIGCFNNCDVYPGHWLLKFIYIGEGGDSEGEGYVPTKEEEVVLDALLNSSVLKHHSTYLDNDFQNPEEYYYQLVVKAGGNQVKIDAYCNGDWGIELNGQPYYKMFDDGKHVMDLKYDPQSPLYFSFDENANPYLPCSVWQFHGLEAWCIDEVAMENPYNTIEAICIELVKRYGGIHKSIVIICGDATSKKQDVKIEKGQDFFTLIAARLQVFKPEIRVPDSNPNNAMRGRFINAVFGIEFEGLHICINSKCSKMREDLKLVKEDPKGKGKAKVKRKLNGVNGVQERGHFGDTMDYVLCEVWRDSYTRYQTGNIIHHIRSGVRVVRNTMDKVQAGLDMLRKMKISKAEEIDFTEEVAPITYTDEVKMLYESIGDVGGRPIPKKFSRNRIT